MSAGRVGFTRTGASASGPEGLRDRSVRLAEASFDALDQAEPGLPDALSDRQQDVWEPLLAIADLAGADWPGRARSAAIGLHSSRSEENTSLQLLEASREIFEGQGVIRSTDLIRGLVEVEDGPWAIWWGKDIADADAHPDKAGATFARLGAKLARELRPFGVASKTIRDGGVTFKGYEREPFEPVWERYLPPISLEPVTEVTAVTPQVGPTSTVTAVTDVTVSEHKGEPLLPDCAECGRPWFQGHGKDCLRGAVR